MASYSSSQTDRGYEQNTAEKIFNPKTVYGVPNPKYVPPTTTEQPKSVAGPDTRTSSIFNPVDTTIVKQTHHHPSPQETTYEYFNPEGVVVKTEKITQTSAGSAFKETSQLSPTEKFFVNKAGQPISIDPTVAAQQNYLATHSQSVWNVGFGPQSIRSTASPFGVTLYSPSSSQTYANVYGTYYNVESSLFKRPTETVPSNIPLGERIITYQPNSLIASLSPEIRTISQISKNPFIQQLGIGSEALRQKFSENKQQFYTVMQYPETFTRYGEEYLGNLLGQISARTSPAFYFLSETEKSKSIRTSQEVFKVALDIPTWFGPAGIARSSAIGLYLGGKAAKGEKWTISEWIDLAAATLPFGLSAAEKVGSKITLSKVLTPEQIKAGVSGERTVSELIAEGFNKKVNILRPFGFAESKAAAEDVYSYGRKEFIRAGSSLREFFEVPSTTVREVIAENRNIITPINYDIYKSGTAEIVNRLETSTTNLFKGIGEGVSLSQVITYGGAGLFATTIARDIAQNPSRTSQIIRENVIAPIGLGYYGTRGAMFVEGLMRVRGAQEIPITKLTTGEILTQENKYGVVEGIIGKPQKVIGMFLEPKYLLPDEKALYAEGISFFPSYTATPDKYLDVAYLRAGSSEYPTQYGSNKLVTTFLGLGSESYGFGGLSTFKSPTALRTYSGGFEPITYRGKISIPELQEQINFYLPFESFKVTPSNARGIAQMLRNVQKGNLNAIFPAVKGEPELVSGIGYSKLSSQDYFTIVPRVNIAKGRETFVRQGYDEFVVRAQKGFQLEKLFGTLRTGKTYKAGQFIRFGFSKFEGTAVPIQQRIMSSTGKYTVSQQLSDSLKRFERDLKGEYGVNLAKTELFEPLSLTSSRARGYSYVVTPQQLALYSYRPTSKNYGFESYSNVSRISSLSGFSSYSSFSSSSLLSSSLSSSRLSSSNLSSISSSLSSSRSSVSSYKPSYSGGSYRYSYVEPPSIYPYPSAYNLEKKKFKRQRIKEKVYKVKANKYETFILPDLFSVSLTELSGKRALTPKATEKVKSLSTKVFRGYSSGFVPTEQLRKKYKL